MRKVINYSALLVLFALLFSCKEDELIVPYGEGDPTIELKQSPKTALFGDSLQFTVNVADQSIDLSTLKVELLFSEQKVSEIQIRTKENGEYSGKLFVPFHKNIPNGTATLRYTLENVQRVKEVHEEQIALSRPDFPYLTLVAGTTKYRMERVAANQYELTQELPMKVSGYIEAPKVGNFGNIIQFGYENSAVVQGINTAIPFSNTSAGVYTIAFNTLTYEASPFLIGYSINGESMKMVNENQYAVDLNVTQGQELEIEGIEGFNAWWLDKDFIREEGGKYYVNAMTGKYRFTADFDKEYMKIEPMSGNDLAHLNADGTGAIWIIGEGIGKPSVAANEVGWDTGKAISLAPMGNKKYQVTVVAGQTIKTDNINFKFFHQKNWGGEFKHTDITTNSDVVFVGDGSNGRDSGNLGLSAGKTLEAGATYVFVVDLSEGNNKAKLTVTKL